MDTGDELGIWSTPSFTENGILFTASYAGKLTAYNLDTEEIKWQVDLGNSSRGTNSSPYLGPNGLLYIGGGNGTVFALRASTGEVFLFTLSFSIPVLDFRLGKWPGS